MKSCYYNSKIRSEKPQYDKVKRQHLDIDRLSGESNTMPDRSVLLLFLEALYCYFLLWHMNAASGGLNGSINSSLSISSLCSIFVFILFVCIRVSWRQMWIYSDIVVYVCGNTCCGDGISAAAIKTGIWQSKNKKKYCCATIGITFIFGRMLSFSWIRYSCIAL